MPKQIVTAIGLIVSLGVIALGVFLVALPIFFQSAAVDTQTATVASTNAIYQTQVDTLNAQKANLDTINANVNELRSQIPATGQLDGVFEVVGKAAQSSGVQITSITAGDQVAYVPRTGATEANAPAPEPTPSATPTPGATASGTGTATPTPPSIGGRQQVDFVISATATDMNQATAFLDALRAGPRLLSSITATTTQSGEAAISVQISALTYLDSEG